MLRKSNMFKRTIELLNDTYVMSVLPKLKGNYFGESRNELRQIFHMAYWMYDGKKIPDNEVERLIFNMITFKLTKEITEDIYFILDITKSLCN